MSRKVTVEEIKNIAREIILDNQEWVNDSHTESEHHGIVVGLYELIEKLGGTTDDMLHSNEWR